MRAPYWSFLIFLFLVIFRFVALLLVLDVGDLCRIPSGTIRLGDCRVDVELEQEKAMRLPEDFDG